MLALLVVTIWGANFTVIKLGLDDVPAMLLAALRYTFTVLPAIVLVRRPAIEWYYCVAYGLTVGIGQFGCLFYAMDIGIQAGIASVVLQSQAFFTLIFAAILLGEPIMAGIIIAALGLYLIGKKGHVYGGSAIPLAAFLLALLAAAFWGISNIIIRHAATCAESRGKRLEMLNLGIWSSLVPPFPLVALASLLDKPQTIWQAVHNLDMISGFAVLYLAYFTTLFGFGTWSSLLGRYPAGQVAPLSLLVPVTGLITAHII